MSINHLSQWSFVLHLWLFSWLIPVIHKFTPGGKLPSNNLALGVDAAMFFAAGLVFTNPVHRLVNQALIMFCSIYIYLYIYINGSDRQWTITWSEKYVTYATVHMQLYSIFADGTVLFYSAQIHCNLIKGLSPVTRNLCCQSARGNRSGAVRYFPETDSRGLIDNTSFWWQGLIPIITW